MELISILIHVQQLCTSMASRVTEKKSTKHTPGLLSRVACKTEHLLCKLFAHHIHGVYL